MAHQLPAMLAQHADRLKNQTIADLYKGNKQRDADYCARLNNDITLYYGRHAIDDAALQALLDFAKDSGLAQKRNAMFAGEHVNTSENRAALHMALRAETGDSYRTDGEDVVAGVLFERTRMLDFAEMVRTGVAKGISGKAFTDIVHIGIGGSYLGPAMAVQALAHYAGSNAQKIHFCSNVDPDQISLVLKPLNPETTLILVASKTFTTSETMANADIAKQWLINALGETAVSTHCVALSSNIEAANNFGITQARIFPLADWVGGRFSLWSSIGLSLAIRIGKAHFLEFLAGAREADQHFYATPFERNIPVLMALISIWHRSLNGAQAQAILPYASALTLLPAYLQQLEMESNGKTVTADNQPVTYPTAPVIFGAVGTDCQHSFLQMLHQGAMNIPADFIAAVTPNAEQPASSHKLLANLLAQSAALVQGRSLQEADNDANAVIQGNRPHSLLMFKALNPRTLGSLIAIYEHVTAARGFMWGLNSFDQPGVELGKLLTKNIELQISQKPPVSLDDFTNLLTATLKNTD